MDLNTGESILTLDLLTSYATEEAPDKFMKRLNPARKGINKSIAEKKAEIKDLKQQYANKLNNVKRIKTASRLPHLKRKDLEMGNKNGGSGTGFT